MPCWPNHPEASWELAWLHQRWSPTYWPNAQPRETPQSGMTAGVRACSLAWALRAATSRTPRPDGALELRNCPFHRLAQAHQELVCGLNLRLVEGLITGSRQPQARAVLSALYRAQASIGC